ncbi:hypothetical protein L208DRAFT_1496773 [Tricholoma matsutake]|nr:hypothetical protein L208DRAFT_1496773 [Tricholoma matsutake 945]
MYDFINPQASINCRRIVPEVYFGNDQTHDQSALNDHLLHNLTTPSGCTRCAPKGCVICCDLCNPGFFEHYRIPLTKQIQIPAKSCTKTFEMTATSNNLKTEIFDWRR